jgi:hypothetical protein
MGKGKSPGPSGLRTEHLWDMIENQQSGHFFNFFFWVQIS